MASLLLSLLAPIHAAYQQREAGTSSYLHRIANFQQLHQEAPPILEIDVVSLRDVEYASNNWKNWQDVFEHQGAIQDNPLLENPQRFYNFLGEYSVGRTIRANTRDDLRTMLRSDEFAIQDLAADTTGRLLDIKQNELRPQFAVCNGRRRLISVLSKIMALTSPGTFNAWDKFARIGLQMEHGSFRYHANNDYSTYITAINELLSQPLGAKIRTVCAGRYPSTFAATSDRFHRRVLDTYLMRVGERNF